MNERFEKIAVEVFFDESTNEPGQKMYTFGELKMQKFAELIVRECANEILKWKDEPFPFDEDFAARLIMDHFEVK